MNSLIIYTRSYINSNGDWVMNPNLIDQMHKLYRKTSRKQLRWVVLISGLDNDKLKSECISKLPKGTRVGVNKFQLSASEARKDIINELSKARSPIYDFYMNLDSDDELINQDDLISFINYEKFDSDLISFGLELSEESKLPKIFSMSIENMLENKRYINLESQCMFLFLVSRKVLLDIWVNNWVTPLPKSDPNESLEDLRMAINVAKKGGYRISTICQNFIRYIEHPNQVSNNQENGELDRLHLELKSTKQLFANHKHYRFDENNNLITWNPYESNK